MGQGLANYFQFYVVFMQKTLDKSYLIADIETKERKSSMENIRFSPLKLRRIIELNRQKARMNQLAEAVGISEGTLRNWMRGQGEPNLTEASKLAACLGIELEDLGETV